MHALTPFAAAERTGMRLTAAFAAYVAGTTNDTYSEEEAEAILLRLSVYMQAHRAMFGLTPDERVGEA